MNPATEACDDANAVEVDGCDTSCRMTAERISEDMDLHVCAVRDGALRCWGYNGYGQLGYGNLTDLGDEKSDLPPADVAVGGSVLRVSTGGESTCVLLDAATDNVRCWGFARAALGNCADRDTCMELHLGGRPGDLPAPAIQLGGRATQVASGGRHTCVLREDGGVLCWGDNEWRQLGYPDLADDHFHDHPGGLGRIPLPDAIQIAPGGRSTCALLRDDRSVRCWGTDAYGVPGMMQDPSQAPAVALAGPAARIAAGSLVMCAVLESGALACWGDNTSGQLGTGALGGMLGPQIADLGGERAADVAIGLDHVCALLVGGRLRCWGGNEYGQLGHPPLGAVVADPMAFDPVDLGPRGVIQVGAGVYASCALLADGGVRCWGGNFHGQLGHGTGVAVGGAPGDMPPEPSILYEGPELP